MEVMNCRGCGRLFNYIGGQQLCPACKDQLEKKFMEVKEYIREHPEKNISQVSEDMDVSIRQLKNWVRQERLIFSEESKVMIECEQCGASIRTGRFCEKCKKNMADNLSKLYQADPQSMKRQHDGDRLRYLK